VRRNPVARAQAEARAARARGFGADRDDLVERAFVGDDQRRHELGEARGRAQRIGRVRPERLAVHEHQVGRRDPGKGVVRRGVGACCRQREQRGERDARAHPA